MSLAMPKIQGLENYEMKKKIGEGAMGDVFLATDTRLDRDVAIKFLRFPDDKSAEARNQFLERFLREAKAVAKLNHPNIVGLFDIGHDKAEDMHYMIMEYVKGHNLSDIFEKGGSAPLPFNTALNIALDMCSALAYAHRFDIVHRDIKPANIMLTADTNEAKLTDFGIARVETDPNEQKLTQAGFMLGSFIYSSPEQLSNASNVDARADIYSLAATIYELMTGKAPYEAASVALLIQKVFTEEPLPPSQHIADLPPEIDAILLKALAKSPDDRFANAHEMKMALQALAGSATHTPNVQIALPDNMRSTQVPLSVGGNSLRDTTISGKKFSFKTTTYNQNKKILKYLRNNHLWLDMVSQKYDKRVVDTPYAEIKDKLKEADINGDIFSGLLKVQATYVMIYEGYVVGAVDTSENLVNDDAIQRIAEDSSPVTLYNFGAENASLAVSLSNFIKGNAEVLQNNMDSTLVNLFPVVDDLKNGDEPFTGYLVCEVQDQESLNEDNLSASYVFFFNNGQQIYSFGLDQEQHVADLEVDLEKLIAETPVMVSLYKPRFPILDTVLSDLLLKTTIFRKYHDEIDGSLNDILMMGKEELTHCLSEAVAQNIKLEVSSSYSLARMVFEQDEIDFKGAITNRLQYKLLNWLVTELFFSINTSGNIDKMKRLYDAIPQLDNFRFNVHIENEFGCQPEFSAVGYNAAGQALILVRVGEANSMDLESFIYDVTTVQNGGNDTLLAAVYVSEEKFNPQTLAVYHNNVKKEGFFNKQKGLVKTKKDGFHLVVSEYQNDSFTIVAPTLF